jgi:long-chain fatty acid transport protein
MDVTDGDANFTVPSAGPIAARFPNTKFNAALPLPANTTLGLGYRPTDKLTIAADIQFVEWSAYKSLRFDYQANINGSNFSESPRNYENVFIYRLGAQYAATDNLTVRAGGYYDQSPVQAGYLTPETPDSDAIGVSAGLSYRVSDHFNVDASFLYLNRKQRTDAANLSGGIAGTYKSVGYVPGIGVSYNF